MTEKQKQFVEKYTDMFRFGGKDIDCDALKHQLGIVAANGYKPIVSFTQEETDQIWAAISEVAHEYD